MALDKGRKLWTEDGRQVIVEKTLSNDGGSADIYRVNIGDESFALKWFKLDEIKYGGKDYIHIKENLLPYSPPAPNFCWPLAIVTDSKKPNNGDAFGYIMPLKPDNYYEMKYFLQDSSKPKAKAFANRIARLTACIEIAFALRKLHSLGLCYQDLNQGNFCFDPATGNVYVVDVDPIIVNRPDADTEVKGMRGYMAPEIPRSKYRGHPSTLTDYYSMAVVLYRLMFIDHPMEGSKCARVPMWTDLSEEEVYELHPTFCFDPNDDSNRPNNEWASNANARWKYWPQLHEKFIRSFTVGVNNPNMRITENEWIDVFSNIRDLLIDVPKKGCLLVDFKDPQSVPNMCLKMTNTNKGNAFGDAAIYHGKTFTMHTITNNTASIHEPAMYVFYDSTTQKFAIKNFSKETWKVYDPSLPTGQQTFSCKPGDSFPVSAGVQIQFRITQTVNYVGIISDPKHPII